MAAGTNMMTVSDLRNAGFKAALDGRPYDACPYSPKSWRIYWQEGYRAGFEIAQERVNANAYTEGLGW